MKKIRIGYILGGYKGLKFFKKFNQSYDIAFVGYTFDKIQYDEKVGDEFYKLFTGYNLIDLKTDKLPEADLIFVVGYNRIIKEIKPNMIVFHDSRLPKYRGWSPTVSQLINNESYLGVSAFFPTKGFDEGNIIKTRITTIHYPIKIRLAYDLVIKMYSDVANEIIKEYNDTGFIPSTTQTGDPSYCLWRDERDYRIDWKSSAEEIKRFVDALGYPYQGALTFLEGLLVKVNEVQVIKGIDLEYGQPGKVFNNKNNQPVVVCGSGMVKLLDYESISGKKNFLSRLRVRFE